MSAALQLVPYALIAALSPLGVAATLTVMRTGRLQALGFGIGVVAGQLLACGLLVLLGSVTIPHRTKAHPTLEGVLALGLGLALLVLAVVVRRRPEVVRPASTSGRSQAALERLGHVHVLTALAAASISASGIAGADEGLLVVWYGLLATVLVWLPVGAYLLLGDLVVARLDAALAWLARQRRPVTVYALVLLGIALTVNGVLLL